MLVMHLLTTWMHIVVFVLCLNSGYKILTNSRAIGEDVQKFVYKETTAMQTDIDLELYPNYGEEWIYFPDGNGELQVAFLVDQENSQNDFADEKPSAKQLLEAVTFTLYTINNTLIGEELLPTNASIAKSSFDPNKPTKAIVHGWLSSGRSDTCQGIKNEYLKYNDYNVIVVDWSPIASSYYYPRPMAATRNIGKYYASLLDNLIDTGAQPCEIHLIGHSLGAHISGFAGKEVRKGYIGRVTGLDPALPGFKTGMVVTGRLSRHSAKFVDIIHSCSGMLGIAESIGHADFYPNGGSYSQPGCGHISAMMEACSHGRSWEYFRDSISANNTFVSKRCADFDSFLGEACDEELEMMGEPVSHSARGRFYLRTASLSPFAISI